MKHHDIKEYGGMEVQLYGLISALHGDKYQLLALAILTNSMELTTTREATSCEATQGCPSIL
jgi:hypothetical protein